MDAIPGFPGCAVTGASNRLYVDWVLLMSLDIGRFPALPTNSWFDF